MRISGKEAAVLTFVLFALMMAVLALFAQNLHLKQQHAVMQDNLIVMDKYLNLMQHDLDSVCAVISVLDPDDALDTQQCAWSSTTGEEYPQNTRNYM